MKFDKSKHFTADLSVGKQFRIREEVNFEFWVEARNALNHPVFAAPDTAGSAGIEEGNGTWQVQQQM